MPPVTKSNLFNKIDQDRLIDMFNFIYHSKTTVTGFCMFCPEIMKWSFKYHLTPTPIWWLGLVVSRNYSLGITLKKHGLQDVGTGLPVTT